MGERIQNFGAVSQTFFGFSPSFLHFRTSRLKVGHSLESISDFFEIVSFETRIHISLYDTAGNGYLTETNLQEYISELIPTFVHLKNTD